MVYAWMVLKSEQTFKYHLVQIAVIQSWATNWESHIGLFGVDTIIMGVLTWLELKLTRPW